MKHNDLVCVSRPRLCIGVATFCLALLAVLFSTDNAFAQNETAKDIFLPQPAPAMPQPTDLVVYFSPVDSRNRYLLDLTSITRLEDEGIRFSTVIETAGGVRNLRHDAFRCKSGELKLLAIGRADATWLATPNSAWQPVSNGSALGYPGLYRVLCFGGATAERSEVLRRIANPVPAY